MSSVTLLLDGGSDNEVNANKELRCRGGNIVFLGVHHGPAVLGAATVDANDRTTRPVQALGCERIDWHFASEYIHPRVLLSHPARH